jgi:hypothetical protein
MSKIPAHAPALVYSPSRASRRKPSVGLLGSPERSLVRVWRSLAWAGVTSKPPSVENLGSRVVTVLHIRPAQTGSIAFSLSPFKPYLPVLVAKIKKILGARNAKIEDPPSWGTGGGVALVRHQFATSRGPVSKHPAEHPNPAAASGHKAEW